MGYHELEMTEINVAWDAIIRESGDYAFPNNYYRSLILYAAAMYVQTSPEFITQPTSADPDSQAVADAARAALEIIKENVNFDKFRVDEATNLGLMGNSFRYSYYSLDPRYGYTTGPVYETQQISIPLHNGYAECPACLGIFPLGTQVCPSDGSPCTDAPPESLSISHPVQAGQTRWPKGQHVTECVWPMEVYVRSSVPCLERAPYLSRKRVVDRVALQAAMPRLSMSVNEGDTASEASADLGLVYQQSVPDLPSDPMQYAAWYERATAPQRAIFIQQWIRPAMYAHDKDLRDEFPDGLYAAVCSGQLLDSKNESMDDCWVHIPFRKVPGRFWADGYDDIVPKQLQLDAVDRMILRNCEYNSFPQTYIDSQRLDKNGILNDAGQVNEVKPRGDRPVNDAVMQLEGMSLPQDVYVWRAEIIQDMQFHTGVSAPAIGLHEPGVNSFGQQQSLTARALGNLAPFQLVYKEENEKWAFQVLKLAADNWLDERVHAAMGIDNQWEYQKLKGEMLDLDRVRVRCRVEQMNVQQQQGLAQAVASGLLNPADPRVQHKALELYQLPPELDSFTRDAKTQWKEIDKMKQGQDVEPVLLRDNDDVHIETCRRWLNSDDPERFPPQVQAIVYQHMLKHLANKQKMAMVMAQIGGQHPQPQQPPPAGAHPGQPSPQEKQARAIKGAAAKPHQPQPPGGNQYQIGPRGTSPSAVRRQRQGQRVAF